ncbi:MAG TPA: hypothetical protein VFR97_15195 [Capillimicrobium sp.]|nr:hypothetical protein [Capillimicrobium sp.]
MSPVPAADIPVHHDADEVVEETYAVGGRLVSVVAGASGIGALTGLEGAAIGAALGVVLTFVLERLSHRQA